MYLSRLLTWTLQALGGTDRVVPEESVASLVLCEGDSLLGEYLFFSIVMAGGDEALFLVVHSEEGLSGPGSEGFLHNYEF